jgi:PhnB protein
MSDPTPYIHFPGTARAALTFYGEVFGGDVQLFTLGDFNRDDGPVDAIAHGTLTGGPVALFGSDAVNEPAFHSEGLMLALLGTADPATLTGWFERLSDGGRVVDALQVRSWGAHDGQVVDQYGIHWLIGYEGE